MDIIIQNLTTEKATGNGMGSHDDRSWEMSQITIVGDQFHFNFKWSDENVELWHFDVGDDDFTEDEDAGATTELPEIKQHAIAYDNSDKFLFVLGTGTVEISTIVAQVAANVNDGEYINYSAIELDYENVRSEKDYYIWFDKVGDESGDPAPAGRTKITVDISADVTAQNVSDSIEAAVNAVNLITCDNAGGTTCTLTNHYNGNTTNIADVDTGWVVATITPGVNNTYYLYTYSISMDGLTKGAEYNIALMLNRNTNSTANPPFNLEKAFHITDGKIYQIAKNRGTLNYISTLENVWASAVILAITDTYMIIDRDNDGDPIQLWKYNDRIDEVTKIKHDHPTFYEGGVPVFDLYAIKTLAQYLDKDMFIQIIGIYSRNSSSTANSVIMEGTIFDYSLQNVPDQKFLVRSQAFHELTRIYPNISDYSNYTGKTSGQIISQLITDFCVYITAGTISNGVTTWTCPDDWKAEADKDLLTVINELAETEIFVARIRPQGELDFDNATTATGVSVISTSDLRGVKVHPISETINFVKVWGGYVGAIPTGPVTAENIASQQLQGGITPWYKTIATITNLTKLQTYADNKLTLLSQAPVVVNMILRDIASGLLQPAETVSLGANIDIRNSDQTVPVGIYIIMSISYDPKNQEIALTLSDGLVGKQSSIREDPKMTLPQENNQLIRQVANTLHNLVGGFILFFNDDASGDIGGYKQLTTTIADDALATSATPITGADQEVEQWATESGVPALNLLLSGIMEFHYHAWQSGGAGKKDIRIYFKFYERADPGGAETLLFTTEESDLLPNATADGAVHALTTDVELATTDRLVVKLFATPYGSGGNPTLSFSIEGTTATRVEIPAPIGSITDKPTITQDSGAPAITPAAVGDVYINTDTYNMYMAAHTNGYWGFGFIGRAQAAEFDLATEQAKGLKAWFDAALGITKGGSDLISQWNDQSGEGNNLLQAVETNKPLWVDAQFNGFPIVRFDGVDNFMKTAGFVLAQPETVFIVIKILSNTGEDYWLDGLTNSMLILERAAGGTAAMWAGVYLDDGAFIDNTIYLFTALFNGVNSTIRQNGDAESTGNAGAVAAGGITVGATRTPAAYANIEIAEILVYNTALSAANQTIVRNYLSNKYAIY